MTSLVALLRTPVTKSHDPLSSVAYAVCISRSPRQTPKSGGAYLCVLDSTLGTKLADLRKPPESEREKEDARHRFGIQLDIDTWGGKGYRT